MRRYATGAKLDPPGYRRTPVHHLFARAQIQVPDSVTLEASTPPVFDQGPLGACVGAALACAIATALTVEGTPLPWVPSPGVIYTGARVIDRPPPIGDAPPTPLQDEGSAPNEAERWVGEWGVKAIQAPTPDGRFFDMDPTNVNVEPQMSDLEVEATSLIVGSYGIYTTGAARGADVRASVAGGYPVSVSVPGGSSAWQSYTSGVIGATGEPLDHETVIIAYELAADGYRYRIRNSWSEGWGIAGDCWVSEAALAEFGDLIVWRIERMS